MTNEEINAVKGLVGSVRGAQVIVSREGVRPQMTLDIVAGVEDGKVIIEHIILDAPVKNPAGEDVNIFTTTGVARPAYPGEVFVANNEKVKVRKAEAAPRFLCDGKWSETYAPAATKVATKVVISHRIDVDALQKVSRTARRKDGENWTNIAERETTANLPVGEGRVTFTAIKRYKRLTEGGLIHLLPLPAEAVSSQRATASGACEMD